MKVSAEKNCYLIPHWQKQDSLNLHQTPQVWKKNATRNRINKTKAFFYSKINYFLISLIYKLQNISPKNVLRSKNYLKLLKSTHPPTHFWNESDPKKVLKYKLQKLFPTNHFLFVAKNSIIWINRLKQF